MQGYHHELVVSYRSLDAGIFWGSIFLPSSGLRSSLQTYSANVGDTGFGGPLI